MQIGNLSHYVRVYDTNLDAALCRRMIDSFGGLARVSASQWAGRASRSGESAWTELNVTALPNTPRVADLVMKRYRLGKGEQFQLHVDAINFVANRYLVMLWYLDDVADGGETSFPHSGLDDEPKERRLLMFLP